MLPRSLETKSMLTSGKICSGVWNQNTADLHIHSLAESLLNIGPIVFSVCWEPWFEARAVLRGQSTRDSQRSAQPSGSHSERRTDAIRG
jgi:hypothetical protein